VLFKLTANVTEHIDDNYTIKIPSLRFAQFQNWIFGVCRNEIGLRPLTKVTRDPFAMVLIVCHCCWYFTYLLLYDG
jgi:hypothetical protein